MRRFPRLPFVLLPLLGLVAGAAGCGESHMGGLDAGRVEPDACRVTCGRDAPPVPDAPTPDAPPSDGGVASCAADDARAIVCPAGICDGLDSYAWDGERCLRIDCGTCEGADCAALAHSEDECRARHAACAPEQCRATGGQWLFFTEECEHYRCGLPQPSTCEVGGPVCNCGVGRSWVDGVGCAADAACGAIDPLPPDMLCDTTGGTWTDGICCSTTCGQYCPLACAGPGCVCGPLEVFDSLRGCVRATECMEREVGQTCGAGGTRCVPGLLCCASCGGDGCAPDSTCEAPTCDADPNIDECGNNLLAP